MSVAKLSKQLKRELKANPQKAGMLGLLCVVAGWFWGPLVFKSDDLKKTAPTGTIPAVAAVASPTAAPVPTVPGKERMEWRTLSNRLQSDPLMQSVAGKPATTEGSRSPFDPPVKRVEKTDEDLAALLEEANAAGLFDEEKPPAPTQQMMSAALNAYPLMLTSTLVGPRARTAIINGKAYPKGAAIGKINDMEMVLEWVDPRSATIAWNGARRELRILKPGEVPAGGTTEDETQNRRSKDDDAASSDTQSSPEALRALEALSNR